MDWVQSVKDAVLWVVTLAKPENLQAALNLWGPPWVGYCVLFGIVFAETGLLVGFCLPGDSLLFACGFLASQGVLDLWLLMGLLSVAGVLGDAVNYSLGKRASAAVLERGRLKWVKHEHLTQAKEFYDKHGVLSIVLARFVPIVRTFTPFVAGACGMNYRIFAFYNIIGGVLWVVSMTLCGYFLGQIPLVKKNFEAVVVGIVLLSVVPLLVGFLRRPAAAAPAPAEPLAAGETPAEPA